MDLLAKRVYSSPFSLISKFFENGKETGVVLERPWMQGANIHELSAILPGSYQVISVDSFKHGPNWPCLKDVPGRTEIELHIGNYPRDVKGCLAIGSSAGIDMITGSTVAFDTLLVDIRKAWEDKEEVWITIENDFEV